MTVVMDSGIPASAIRMVAFAHRREWLAKPEADLPAKCLADLPQELQDRLYARARAFLALPAPPPPTKPLPPPETALDREGPLPWWVH